MTQNHSNPTAVNNEKPNPPVRLLANFEAAFGMTAPDLVVAAPSRKCWAAVRFNGATFYNVVNGDTGERLKFDLRSAEKRQTLLGRPVPRWARYITGVTCLIDVRSLPGAEIVTCSDEPPGIRDEHALGILFAALWTEINGGLLDENELFLMTEHARRVYVEVGRMGPG